MKNRLRDLCANRGRSQAELAEKLNVLRQTVNAMETEKHDPGLPLTFKIAERFGQRIEKTFTLSPEKQGGRNYLTNTPRWVPTGRSVPGM